MNMGQERKCLIIVSLSFCKLVLHISQTRKTQVADTQPLKILHFCPPAKHLKFTN